MLVLLLLAGCKPHADQPAVPAQAVKARAKPTPTARPALAQGQVRVRGDDALAGVLSWSLPEVAITHPGKARAAARHALASGDLFETANSALPLLLAMLAMLHCWKKRAMHCWRKRGRRWQQGMTWPRCDMPSGRARYCIGCGQNSRKCRTFWLRSIVWGRHLI